MNRQTIATLGAFGLLGVAACSTPPARHGESEQAMSYQERLESEGFVVLPLKRSAAGHFYLPGALDGHPLTVLLDTGASATVLNVERAREWALPLERNSTNAAGAGDSEIEAYSIGHAEVRLGDFAETLDVIYAIDLSNVAKALVARGISPPDLILGADFLTQTDAKIDYAQPSLFVRTRPDSR